SVMYAADGSRLAVIDREVSRKVVPLKRIPKHVRNAVITAEDRKFWRHPGYDVEGIARAAVANVQARGVAEGGSTITQQLAKSEVGTEQTLERKMTELLYAVALENQFTKDELLERYLNQVYFGARAYGVEAAAEEFFRTRANRLTVDQGALLAAMIRSPNSADPRDRPRLAKQRRNAVLAAMAEQGYVKPGRLRKWQRRPLGVKESPSRKRKQPFVVDAVTRELLGNETFGKTLRARERALYYGGLRIHTTLDPQMQEAARDAILSYLPGGAPTGAIASVVPQTGEVKAIASGLDYADLEYDLPTQGRRQPGSAFKPFVYAQALQSGFPLEMSLSGSSPAYFEDVPDWSRDCPSAESCGVENYGGSSYGTLDMPEALQNSVNTAAAQLMLVVGPKNVVQLADRMGVNMVAANENLADEGKPLHNPSLVLGGFTRGTTPLEMASAFGVFANEGKRVQPHLIQRVTDSDGQVLYKAPKRSEEVLDPVVNGAMVEMMRAVVTSGTGTGAQLPSWEVAGKTGTTTDSKDAWFVGYTPVLSTAVWMGHPTAGVEMYGMTGGSTPASIWRSYMGTVLEGRDPVSFPDVDLSELDDLDGGKDVTVPDVVGDPESEALTRLGSRKLVGQISQDYSSAPAGTVIWTSPSAGETASPGDTVYVGVSIGPAPPPPPPPPAASGGGGGDEADKKKDEKQPPDDDEGDDDEGGDDEGGGDEGGGDEERPPPPDPDKGNGGGGNGNGGQPGGPGEDD
ncbi:MAG: transglycosylase domain-containing protein, partial [Egibacteraceae bacterium]